jgi:hypothetical protein
MALDFPNSPTVGATYSSGGVTWTWDGAKWTNSGTGVPGIYLPLSGGTLTGPLTVNGATTIKSGNIDNTVIGATTPAAASITSLNGGQLAGMRNRLINGAMLIDQRGLASAGGGFNPVNGNYTVDRWFYTGTQASKFNAQSNPAGWLSIIIVTPYTPAAADTFLIGQYIEGLNIIDLGWGAAGAKPVTLSFNAYSALTGTHSGAIVNGAGANRSYVFTFNIPVASTWTPIAVTIPGDITGTWAINNTAALTVRFNLGSGANYLGAAGSWGAGNLVGATGSVQVVAGGPTANFAVGSVQLELGSIATPFERRLYGAELALCQRYYQRYTSPGAGSMQILGSPGGASGFVSTQALFPTMRVNPTAAQIGTWTFTNVVGGSFTLSVGAPNNMLMYIQGTPAGANCSAANPANGGFDLNAEL